MLPSLMADLQAALALRAKIRVVWYRGSVMAFRAQAQPVASSSMMACSMLAALHDLGERPRTRIDLIVVRPGREGR